MYESPTLSFSFKILLAALGPMHFHRIQDHLGKLGKEASCGYDKGGTELGMRFYNHLILWRPVLPSPTATLTLLLGSSGMAPPGCTFKSISAFHGVLAQPSGPFLLGMCPQEWLCLFASPLYPQNLEQIEAQGESPIVKQP
jgi:hypothetical protein